MSTLASLFGALLLLFLTISGLVLIVVPALGRRMLQKAASFTAIVFVVLFALSLVLNFLRSVNPLLLILGLSALSAVAHFVREGRLSPKRRDASRHVERSPVMPQHIRGDDQ